MSYAGPAPRRGITVEATLRAERNRHDAALRRAESMEHAADDEGHSTRWAMLGGLAVGLTVGAAVALLFAPESGADTRHALARRGHRLKQRGRDAWDDLRFEMKRAGRRTRNRMREMQHLDEDY